MKLLALEKSATSATKGEQTQLFPLNPLQLTTIPPILISYTTFKALRSRTMMSTPLLLASLVFTAHEASAFLGIAPTRAGLFLPTSGSKIGTRVARSSRIAMTSTTSPQPERSSKEWGDFERCDWELINSLGSIHVSFILGRIQCIVLDHVVVLIHVAPPPRFHKMTLLVLGSDPFPQPIA